MDNLSLMEFISLKLRFKKIYLENTLAPTHDNTFKKCNSFEKCNHSPPFSSYFESIYTPKILVVPSHLIVLQFPLL